MILEVLAAQLVESAEDGLMRSIIAREIHVLRPLCPPVNIRKYDLRPSPHNFLLPLRDDTKSLGLCLDGSDLTPDLNVIFPYNSYLILWATELLFVLYSLQLRLSVVPLKRRYINVQYECSV